MNALAGVVGILAVAAITPGPNNFIVMNAGARHGARAAAVAIGAVVAGSVALYVVVDQAWGEIDARVPYFSHSATLLAAAYLAWLGVALFRAPGGTGGAPALLPASPIAVAAFQFLNPKAWGLMAAVTAGSHASVDRWLLVPVMIVVLAVCLTIWAVGGLMLSRYLEDERAAKRFNRLMGASLIAFAASLCWRLVTDGIRSL